MIVAIVAVCLCAFAACGKKDKVEAINIDLSSEQYAFAVRKTDTALLNSVNQFFAEKMTEVNAILNKYLNATADELAAMRTGITYQTSGDVNNTDSVLVVATNLEFSPFEYINGSEAVGADMEIAKLLAEFNKVVLDFATSLQDGVKHLLYGEVALAILHCHLLVVELRRALGINLVYLHSVESVATSNHLQLANTILAHSCNASGYHAFKHPLRGCYFLYKRLILEEG